MLFDVLRICREDIFKHLELVDICSLFLSFPKVLQNEKCHKIRYNKRKIIVESKNYSFGDVGFITDSKCPIVYHIIMNPSKK